MRGCVPRGQWNVLEMSHLKMHSDNDCHCPPACKAASWSPVLSALALEPSCAFSHPTPCSESQVDALLSLHFRFFLSCMLKFPMPLKVTSHALLVTFCPMSCPGINVNPPTPSLLLSPQPDRHFTINWKTSAFKLLPGDWAGIHTRVSREVRVNSGMPTLGGGCHQSLSRVWLFESPWTAACQASLSLTIQTGHRMGRGRSDKTTQGGRCGPQFQGRSGWKITSLALVGLEADALAQRRWAVSVWFSF